MFNRGLWENEKMVGYVGLTELGNGGMANGRIGYEKGATTDLLCVR